MQRSLKRSIFEWKLHYCCFIYYRKCINYQRNVDDDNNLIVIQFLSLKKLYSHFVSLIKLISCSISSIEMTNYIVLKHLQFDLLNFIVIGCVVVVVIHKMSNRYHVQCIYLHSKMRKITTTKTKTCTLKMVENKSEFGIPHTTNWHFYSNFAVFFPCYTCNENNGLHFACSDRSLSQIFMRPCYV